MNVCRGDVKGHRHKEIDVKKRRAEERDMRNIGKNRIEGKEGKVHL